MPYKTSVIIVSYNNYQSTTGPCLQSLLADEANRGVEIIVVDNGSRDETPGMLERIAAENENLRIILNKKNRGFAGGNNDGAALSQGEILVLLNSDTIVPQGAISGLATRLADNKNWAMLGPVTNSAGNEQKIHIQNTDVKPALDEGRVWCDRSNADCFESRRLDFFCVAIKKDVYENLGGLDEQFGLGYYEDTDFSLKAIENGYKMFFTEKVFIYHKAGKSFSSHGKNNIRKLMKTNKRLLQQKYGHGIRLHHMRDCNLNILNEYARLQQESKDSPDYCRNIGYRFDRRMTLARELWPNNPLKKIKYWLGLRHAARQFGSPL